MEYIDPLTRVLKFVALILLTASATLSCSSSGGSIPANLDSVEFPGDVSLRLDPAEDKHLALEFRNDSIEDQKFIIRITGGDISYHSIRKGSSGKVKAAYLLTESNFTLEPEDEKVIDIFLKNWFLTTVNFNSRLRVDLIDEHGRTRIVFEVDQDDIFDDSRQTIKDNRMGLNNPYGSSYVQVGLGALPGNAVLTFPVDEGN